MSGTRPFGESDIAYITRCRSEGVPFDFPDVIIDGLLATLDAARRASDAQVARKTKPWLVRLTCCGRADGVFAADSWEEAEAFRQSYTSGPGVKGGHVEVPGLTGGHDRSAIVEDALAAAPQPATTECPDCHGDGWVPGVAADPLPSGEPGEPYQVQRTCETCGGNGDLPAPQPATPPLDVERLARAIASEEAVAAQHPEPWRAPVRDWHRGRAAMIAAEYERLGSE